MDIFLCGIQNKKNTLKTQSSEIWHHADW